MTPGVCSISRGVGSAAAAWTPSSIADCQLELDPRDTSTMTQGRDGSGGAPSVDSTDVVGRIYDRSSASRLYSPGADSRRARFRDNASVFDGRKCLEYDKVDDVYVPAAAWAIAGAQTWAVEFQVTSAPAVNGLSNLIGTYIGATGNGQIVITNSASYQTISVQFNVTSTTASVGFGGVSGAGTTANRRRLVITWDGVSKTNPSSWSARLDGVAQTLVASGNFGVSTVWGAMGGTTAVGNLLGGRLGRIAAFSRVLTVGEITSLEGWLDG